MSRYLFLNKNKNNKNNNKLEYIIIFIPIIFVYLLSIVYPITQNIGSNIKFRPPGYVFAIVWPILLILLGISWYNRRNISNMVNLVYIILTILLAIWYILYDINMVLGLIDIIACLLISIFLFFYNFDNYASFTLLPLILWLVFASILNIASIELKNKSKSRYRSRSK